MFEADEFAEEGVEAGVRGPGFLVKEVVKGDFPIEGWGRFLQQSAALKPWTCNLNQTAFNGRQPH